MEEVNEEEQVGNAEEGKRAEEETLTIAIGCGFWKLVTRDFTYKVHRDRVRRSGKGKERDTPIRTKESCPPLHVVSTRLPT